MRYFYLHPFKPQFFFPIGYKKHQVFRNFYIPYSAFGKVSWWLFNHSSLYRFIFSKKNIEEFIPEKNIRKILGNDAILVFNAGTKGSEQKISLLGYLDSQYFFAKYAHTPVSIKNVNNEYLQLRELPFDFIPKVIDFKTSNHSVLLQTTLLSGEKYHATSLSTEIMNLVYTISTYNIIDDGSIIEAYAHGDFCPWNLMLDMGQIKVFDWEMAGVYPLGYDVFTFIFQTQFLLDPQKEIAIIWNENKEIVQTFFGKFGVEKIESYLEAFAEKKCELETQKANSSLLHQYKILKDYAGKA